MMKHRTFALFLALGLSLSLLSGCGPKESGSTSQPGGSPSSSQGSPDASQPDVSLPDASAPDTSAPGESAPEAPQPPVDEPEAVAALALDKSDFSLFKAGSSYQLKATVSGVDAPKVTWTSSDETVAAVSQDGTVTAVAAGTAPPRGAGMEAAPPRRRRRTRQTCPLFIPSCPGTMSFPPSCSRPTRS